MSSAAHRRAMLCAVAVVLIADRAQAQEVIATPAAAEPAAISPTSTEAAETEAAKTTKRDANEITQEVLNSTAPAFAALGISGQTITDPEGLKTAAISLLNGTDADGKPVTGLGVQFAPAQLIPGLQKSYDDYRANPKALFHGPRAFARLQITAAYVRADSNNGLKPERAAIGAIWVPFDTTDPFVNPELDDCLKAQFKKFPLPGLSGQEAANQGSEPYIRSPSGLAPALLQCRAQFRRTPTNGHSAQIGFAKLFSSRDGGKGRLAGSGFAASAVVSIGLDCVFSNPCRVKGDTDDQARSHIGGKLLLGAVFREREPIANPLDDTKFIDRNRQSYGGKLVVGNARAWWLGGEFLHQRASYQGFGKDNFTTYTASLDIKVGKGLWLATNYANSSGDNFGESSQFTAGLKFALQPSSSIGGEGR